MVSSGEDLTVAGVVSLAVLNPWVAAAIALTLLVVGAVLVAVLWRRIRRVRRRWRDWRGRRWDDAPRSPAA